MLSLYAPSPEPYSRSIANAAGVAALSTSDEAAAVVAGYRALQADKELHRHRPGSAARMERMVIILMPVAEAWGIDTRELIHAVGRGVE
jgi:hypothetical protein